MRTEEGEMRDLREALRLSTSKGEGGYLPRKMHVRSNKYGWEPDFRFYLDFRI